MSFLRLPPRVNSPTPQDVRPLDPTESELAPTLVKRAATVKLTSSRLAYICDVIKTCVVAGLPEGRALTSLASLQLYHRLFEHPVDIPSSELIPPLDEFVTRVLVFSHAPMAVIMGTLVFLERIAGDIESHIHAFGAATGHCIFLGSIILATLSLNDSCPRTETWIHSADCIFDATHIRKIERIILLSLDYNTSLSTEELAIQAKIILRLADGYFSAGLPARLRCGSPDGALDLPPTPDLLREGAISPADSDMLFTPPLHSLTEPTSFLDMSDDSEDVEMDDLACTLASGMRSVQNRPVSGSRKRVRPEPTPTLPFAFRPKIRGASFRKGSRLARAQGAQPSSLLRTILSPAYNMASSSLHSLSSSVDSLLRRKRPKVNSPPGAV